MTAAIPTSGLRRTIYDAKHKVELPGVFVRGEGDPTIGDPAVHDACEGGGDVPAVRLDLRPRLHRRLRHAH